MLIIIKNRELNIDLYIGIAAFSDSGFLNIIVLLCSILGTDTVKLEEVQSGKNNQRYRVTTAQATLAFLQLEKMQWCQIQ